MESEIIKLYTKENRTIKYLTIKFNKSKYDIKKILISNGIPIVKRTSSITFTNEEIKEIINRYTIKKESLQRISKSLNLSSSPIKNLLKKAGIRILDFKEKKKENNKYPLKEDFFERIDTWEKAYFLGWLYSDGYNQETKGITKISLQKRDDYVLDYLSSLIVLSEKKPIYYYTDPLNRTYTSLRICSKKISKDLAKLGCFQKKSLTLNFPYFIRDKLLLSGFLQGYFEGDGCAAIDKRKLTAIFICSNLFSIGLVKALKNTLNISANIKSCHGCYQVYFSAQKDIQAIYDFLYKYSNFNLKRKKDKFENHFNIIKEGIGLAHKHS